MIKQEEETREFFKQFTDQSKQSFHKQRLEESWRNPAYQPNNIIQRGTNAAKIQHQRANQKVLSSDLAEVLCPDQPERNTLSEKDLPKRVTQDNR